VSGPVCQWRSGEYVVMPAHSSGATLLKSSEAGMQRTKSSSTTTWVEYPPWVMVPSRSTLQ
jgi:hypothetical protein